MGVPEEEFSGWESSLDAFPWLVGGEGGEGGAAIEPEWAASGSLQIGEGSLTPKAWQILGETLASEYSRRYGSSTVKDDEDRLSALGAAAGGGEAASSPLPDHIVAMMAGLTLRVGEKLLLEAARGAMKGVGSLGGPSEGGPSADSCQGDQEGQPAKRTKLS
mmetsp:Transcript_31524/g.89507  ORF Transcript_31524/g.89507 Transcript_31524/m.89507 type:complete len:162 (-) Transcript_31524:590-1075(-)